MSVDIYALWFSSLRITRNYCTMVTNVNKYLKPSFVYRTKEYVYMKAARCEETFFSLKLVLFIYLTRLSVAQDCAASNIKMISDWNGCEMTRSLHD